jgi:hypothetical protein
MNKEYTVITSTTELNFDISSTDLRHYSSTPSLNFDGSSLAFKVYASTPSWNYELRDYDQAHPIYKVLVDFLESYTYGDVF